MARIAELEAQQATVVQTDKDVEAARGALDAKPDGQQHDSETCRDEDES